VAWSVLIQDLDHGVWHRLAGLVIGHDEDDGQINMSILSRGFQRCYQHTSDRNQDQDDQKLFDQSRSWPLIEQSSLVLRRSGIALPGWGQRRDLRLARRPHVRPPSLPQRRFIAVRRPHLPPPAPTRRSQRAVFAPKWSLMR